MDERKTIAGNALCSATIRKGNVFLVLMLLASAMPTASQAGQIALVIDDIGYSYSAGLRAARLDPSVTLSILPDAPNTQPLAQRLKGMGRELMLHLPMQSLGGESPNESAALTTGMDKRTFQLSVIASLRKVPGISGLNNHMGSLLTSEPEQMSWLMEILRALRVLYFVDSRTTAETVAEKVALEHKVKTTRRNVFLDNGKVTRASVWAQLRRLEREARVNGFALAIGHPFPETLAVLEEGIPWLRAKGHTIVKVSQYIKAKEIQQCPECSSPSLKLVKSSKLSPLSTCCAEPISR